MINILNDLYHSQEQADFWLAYTKTMLSVAPLLLVLFVDSFFMFDDPIEQFKVSLLAALSGILLGMMIVGKRMFIPASQQCSQPRLD